MKRITISLPWPIGASETREILTFAFKTSLASYLVFYLLENIFPGYVITFYHLDTFLWVAIVTGVLASLWPAIVPAAKKPSTQLRWTDILWLIVLALGTVAVVWYKTSSIGWLAKVVAPLSGLIVLGLSLLVYYDRDGDPENAD